MHITDQEYINVFPYPEATLTLKGFKYPLHSHHLNHTIT